MRSLIVALAALILLPAGLWAEEIRGKIKSVDAEANKVIIIVDGKERTMTCIANCPVSTLVTTNRLIRRNIVTEVITSLNSLTPGSQATLTTQTEDGTPMVTQIRLQTIRGQATTSLSSPLATNTGRPRRLFIR